MGRRDIEDLTRMVGEHVKEDGNNHRETTAALKRVENSIDAIEKLPMRAVRWIIGAIVTATIASMVQQRLQHQEQVATANVAAVEATKSAAQTQVVVQKLDNLTQAAK